MARKQTPAQVVIEALGVRPLARALEIDPNNPIRWRNSRGGLVPARYHRDILRISAIEKAGLTASDLVYGRGG